MKALPKPGTKMKTCTLKRRCELMRRALEDKTKRSGFAPFWTLRGAYGVQYRLLSGGAFVCNVCPFCTKPIFNPGKARARSGAKEPGDG